ncbi:response regulator [Methanolacinia paynteri]|uniref:response regulator n=1 Tax=Methanolacinia paynteri TaxID=230356 RepID=UPI000694AB6B|nr:response regulator [Methanolacinia paynteri]
MAAIKVLIAEDEIVLAMGIEKSLKSFGYEVVGKVTRGENAIMMAIDKKPDIILMDIHLEGKVDGIEAAKEIHKKLNIPIIFLTAFSDEETFKKAIEAAPYGYLGKPFRPDDMRTTIEIAISRYRAENAEKALKISEKKYELIFNAMMNGFVLYECMTDKVGNTFDLKVLDVNPSFERIIGFKKEEILGKTILEVIPDWPREWISELGDIGFGGDQISTSKYVFPIKKHLQYNAFSPEYGKVATTFSDISDVVRLKQNEKETLLQIEKNLEQLAILNDEIRNPLQIISGFTQIDNCEHSARILEQVAAIDKLVNLIDQRWLESEKIRDFLRKHYDYI